MNRLLYTLAILFCVLPFTASAQTPDGAEVFQRVCAACHLKPAPDSRAPTREALGEFAPESILTALISGNMFRQGSVLTDAERRAVAGFLAGRPVGAAPPPSNVGRCESPMPKLSTAALRSGWNGWGNGINNMRYQSAAKAGLTATTVPQLKLKWAFGFPGANSARSQPAVVGDVLFVASTAGDVYALNAKSGCTYWNFHAQTGVRTALSVGPVKSAGSSGMAVYFADLGAIAYGLDAATGKQLWSYKVDDHTYATATGSPTLYDGRLYVTTSGVGEEGQGGRLGYECCTFRGSVTALDANSGKVVWKSYAIPEDPKPRGKTKDGVQLWGPAGAGIWSAPTVDAKRHLVYVATGNAYAGPAQRTADAVVAMDIKTGKIKWSNQPLTKEDVFAGGCDAKNKDNNPNCPAALGPDLDFSMSPMLVKQSNGHEVLLAQSKSGMSWAFDPDKNGAIVWQYKTSDGSGLGGQFGGAADDHIAYFGVNGTLSKTPGGMRAVKIDNGEEVWSRPAPDKLCGKARGCSAAQGAAVTLVPGALFSGSMDGGVRAYSTKDGAIIWQFDTNRTFDTVNGVKANGGAMDGPGAVVANGMVYFNSGYVSIIGRPGNVLLAFGVDDGKPSK
ncbi:MAG TPA: PQQ-binding-like beta-propeller repeat protein [Steroidobacteraceae bacterium]|jgi:polyvinyl alcohol dehydrogenase (cytochrome)